MNDYKELVDVLRCGAWSVYKINSPAAMCETIYNAQIADAIEQLVKERDAAVADLRLTNPCIVCKHFSKENCGCDAFYECAVGENDLWEWRGVQECD